MGLWTFCLGAPGPDFLIFRFRLFLFGWRLCRGHFRLQRFNVRARDIAPKRLREIFGRKPLPRPWPMRIVRGRIPNGCNCSASHDPV